jgi:thiol-disulfide isomerase/thioredoxin
MAPRPPSQKRVRACRALASPSPAERQPLFAFKLSRLTGVSPRRRALPVPGESAEPRGLLNVWATWCLECRAELPVLEQLHRDYASRGLTVLALNFREESATVRRYAHELGLTLPLLSFAKTPSGVQVWLIDQL